MAYKFTELNIGPNDSDIIIDIAGLDTIPENYRDRELLKRATLWDSSTGIKYRCSYAAAETDGDLYYSCLDEGYHYYLGLTFGDTEISIERHDEQHLPSEDEVNDLISAALDELDDHSTTTNLTNGSGTNSVQQVDAKATGQDSFAEGSKTSASGRYSHTEGYFSTASGYVSHAEGGATKASGEHSHAEGNATRASGDYSHAEGLETVASGEGSHAEGYFTTASGYATHVEGCEAIALGNIAHVEGTSAFFADEYTSKMPIATVQSTTNILYTAKPEITIKNPQFPTSDIVVGMYMELKPYLGGIDPNRSGPIRVTAVRQASDSTEDYIYTLESALPSVWSSYDVISCQVRLYSAGAQGNLSHAEGATTSAIGRASHAEGFNTTASGHYSHAGGDHTIANGRAQTAIGKYNEENYDALFIVGNGGANNRKNAFEVYADGHAEVQRVGNNPKSIITKEYTTKLQNLIKITYSELKNLRDNEKLISGQQYRIIDYTTATSQENTRAAEHQFDIIVIADSNNTLNENARVIPHDHLAWKPNITPKDVQVLYKLTTSELVYDPPMEESSIVASLTTAINSNGEQVPAFIDSDPDGDGCYKNSLVSVQYVITDDEILYEGNSSINEKDVFVELDYIDDTPVLYKTDPTNSDVDPNNRFEADYADIFYYSGVYTVDDVEYDKWDKYESDEFTGYIILTQHIVENNKFIITQEELINAISYEYIPSSGDCTYIYNGEYELDGEVYDFWIEEYPEDEGFYYGRLTNKVVDTDTYFKDSNLAAWEIKYCLDNDTNRFEWALDVEVASIAVKHNDMAVPAVRKKEWDTLLPNNTKCVWYVGDIFKDSTLSQVVGYDLILTDSEFPKVGDSVEECSVHILEDGTFEISGGSDTRITETHLSGKGVIYYMKDEHNNEAPYDFKNIQFLKHFDASGRFYDARLSDVNDDHSLYVYTFSILNKNEDGLTGEVKDHSVEASTILIDIEGVTGGTECSCNNKIAPSSSYGRYFLPANVLCVTPSNYNTDDDSLDIKNNIFALGADNNCLRSGYGGISDNFLGHSCSDNILEDNTQSVGRYSSFGCYGNKLSSYNYNNIIRGYHNRLGNVNKNNILTNSAFVNLEEDCDGIKIEAPATAMKVLGPNRNIKVKSGSTGTLKNVTIGRNVGTSKSVNNPKYLYITPDSTAEIFVRAAGYKEIILEAEE